MGFEEKNKQIDELTDKLLQAEKNKEILQKAAESEAKALRIAKARFAEKEKEMNAKMEKLEIELREKTQESKIASSKIRELQASGSGLPAVKRESVALKPLDQSKRSGTTERNSKAGKTT